MCDRKSCNERRREGHKEKLEPHAGRRDQGACCIRGSPASTHFSLITLHSAIPLCPLMTHPELCPPPPTLTCTHLCGIQIKERDVDGDPAPQPGTRHHRRINSWEQPKVYFRACGEGRSESVHGERVGLRRGVRIPTVQTRAGRRHDVDRDRPRQGRRHRGKRRLHWRGERDLSRGPGG